MPWPTACKRHFIIFSRADKLTHMPWPTVCEWHCDTFSKHSQPMSFNDQQEVSPLLSISSLLDPWPTECEWHCTFVFSRQLYHQISSSDYQLVSDPALSSFSSLIIPISNSKWATLHFLEIQHSDTNPHRKLITRLWNLHISDTYIPVGMMPLKVPTALWIFPNFPNFFRWVIY